MQPFIAVGMVEVPGRANSSLQVFGAAPAKASAAARVTSAAVELAVRETEDPGVLVLSRFAGAAEQMASAVIVNPYDRWEVSTAIHEAIEMSKEERTELWKAWSQAFLRPTSAAT